MLQQYVKRAMAIKRLKVAPASQPVRNVSPLPAHNGNQGASIVLKQRSNLFNAANDYLGKEETGKLDCFADKGLKQQELKKASEEESTAAPSLKTVFADFCDYTTLHGIKHVFEPQAFLLRKLFWFILVISGAGFFIFQLTSSILHFMSHPTTVNVKINYNDTIRFPAITICNINTFKMTSSVEERHYELLSDIYSESKAVNWTLYPGSQIPMNKLYKDTAHQKEDFLVSCKWNKQQCGVDDFAAIATDQGICYIFNGNGDPKGPRAIKETGVAGGLSLQINIEQYEFMHGPGSGAGVRFLLHSPNVTPNVKRLGTAVPPGSHSYVAIQAIQVNNLEEPYGSCVRSFGKGYREYSLEECHKRCRVEYVMQQCGCVDIYMVDSESDKYLELTEDDNEQVDTPVCTLQQHTECLTPALDTFDFEDTCNYCPVSCKNINYIPLVSYSSLSNYDTKSLMFSNITGALQEKISYAQETRQRVVHQTAIADRSMIVQLISSFKDLVSSLQQQIKFIEEAKKCNEGLLSDFRERLEFHFREGLEGVEYIMKHDFERGWMIRKERAIDFVTNDFYAIINNFRETAEALSGGIPQNDTNLRSLHWVPFERMLTGRIALAERAKVYLNSANYSYSTGNPMLTYRKTIDRRYDMSYITLDVLHAKFGKSLNTYVSRFRGSIDRIIKSLKVLQNLGKTFVQNGFYDNATFDDVSGDFVSACKSYNYRLYQFERSIVPKPVEEIRERKNDFIKVNDSLYSTTLEWVAVLNEIHKIEGEALHLLQTQATKISTEILRYLNDTNVTKEELAATITAMHLADITTFIRTLLDNVKYLSINMPQIWRSLSTAYANSWSNLINEKATERFYEMIQNDFKEYLSGENRKGEFIRIFASMLEVDISSLNNTYPDMDLAHRLNADVFMPNVSVMMDERNVSFCGLDQFQFLTTQIKSARIRYFQDYETYKTTLESYIEQLKISEQFFLDNFVRLDFFLQELRYEEITQQKAYDIINLLGDIGGSLGLFMGASVMTVAEILDLMLFMIVQKLLVRL